MPAHASRCNAGGREFVFGLQRDGTAKSYQTQWRPSEGRIDNFKWIYSSVNYLQEVDYSAFLWVALSYAWFSIFISFICKPHAYVHRRLQLWPYTVGTDIELRWKNIVKIIKGIGLNKIKPLCTTMHSVCMTADIKNGNNGRPSYKFIIRFIRQLHSELAERLGADSAQGDTERGWERKYGGYMRHNTVEIRVGCGRAIAGRGFLVPGLLMIRFIQV
jgi:hypothetical protein